MDEIRSRFLAHIPEGGLILDAGCGSGRDAKAFLDLGYRVEAFDACPELAELAAKHIGREVRVKKFHELEEEFVYDGIWACASLLHVPGEELPATLGQLWQALKPGGTLYLSFKHGRGERKEDGRHFTDATEECVERWLSCLPGFESVQPWITQEPRLAQTVTWTNAIAKRSSVPADKLITGGESPFFPHLCAAMAQAAEIELAVAFVKTTGLRLLLPYLHDALELKKVRVRVVTSDYLDITDPEALRLLMLLAERGAQVRMFEAGEAGFHLKAYLFVGFDENGGLRGQAFIGSSNISRQALQNGMEWNYRIDFPGDRGFLEVRNRFEELFRHPRSTALTDRWIAEYARRRVEPTRGVAPGSLEKEQPPVPTSVQEEALSALEQTRTEGYQRGLVVMATGLGKTWLAAFDARQCGARRILFVAHREEILQQAAETFLRIWPERTAGFYNGQAKSRNVDILCASVQTLGKERHYEQFGADHFDYVVVDEFHHAAAATYRRLINYLKPRFLLGLTATPDRTDQSDILSLCDDNLVFRCGLIEGIQKHLLAPFHYYGIFDEEVDYREIPWRNGRFDPQKLENKIATLARARHALRQWHEHGQSRTLAFCVSVNHANFMAGEFTKAGIRCAPVHGESRMSRQEALEKLHSGELQIIFSVDLFNEGVDLPAIDTVMILRPTESRILFLQQIGRGLRRMDGKSHLTILDFVGNHHSFLKQPQALFGVDSSWRALAQFIRTWQEGKLSLPDGCYVNYDLRLIEFLKSLNSSSIEEEYDALKETLGRRPVLLEFYRSGASLGRMRQQFGHWAKLVAAKGDTVELDSEVNAFLRELEVTQMTKSYKMVLVEAFLELEGWQSPRSLTDLTTRSWEVLRRRRQLLSDLPLEMPRVSDVTPPNWSRYWKDNPVNAWIGGNRQGGPVYFRLVDGMFTSTFAIPEAQKESFAALVQEITDFRLASYEARSPQAGQEEKVVPIASSRQWGTSLPFFPDLQIACGHFRSGRHDVVEHRMLRDAYGRLDENRHFIARASGNSMNGGKNPIRDGDYLLLESISPNSAGSITGNVLVIENEGAGGDDQFLLRTVLKGPDGNYILRANNPDYPDMPTSEDYKTVARFKAVLNPLDLMIGQAIPREEIPPFFGEEYNPGNWNSGHVILNAKKVHVLLVTLNKRGRLEEHRYRDNWIDDATFHWQSQNQTSPSEKKGREVIDHEKIGIGIHLFVREERLQAGKGAPFVYCGPVEYRSHAGEKPMSVMFDVLFRPKR